MLNIEYSNVATEQLNEIYENDNIYIGTSFTQQFINWNHEFYRYVNENAISKHKLYSQGIYTIGKIGKLEYKYYCLFLLLSDKIQKGTECLSEVT